MQAECTLATIDFSIIQKNLEHSDNSTKKRKRRAFLRNQTLREIPETLYSFSEDLSSGKVCSGIGCGRGIHTIITSIIHYERLPNLCYEQCAAITTRLHKHGDYHYDRNMIMIEAFTDKFVVCIKPQDVLLNDIDNKMKHGTKQVEFVKKLWNHHLT